MRLLVGMVGVLAMVVLLLGGIALTGIGAMNLYDDHTAYHVAFKKPSDGCGARKVTFDVQSGKPLFCTSLPTVPGHPTASLPGFTDEQNANVFALAEQLADDGLSKAEQQKIQASVSDYAATVPQDKRPQHGFWWGSNNLIGGLGAVGAGTLLYAALRRIGERLRSRAS